MQEKQDQKVVLVSLSIHINLKHEEHKSLTQNFFFFFFSHSQVLLNFLSNHITMKEIKLFNLSLKHPFGPTFSKSIIFTRTSTT